MYKDLTVLRYAARRILSAAPVLWFVATLTFFLMHAAPGDPWQALYGGSRNRPDTVSAAYEAGFNRKYGLDKPLYVQYSAYLLSAATFDWGVSFSEPDRPVSDILRRQFPVTARIGVSAFLAAVLLGVPAGVVAARRRGTWVDLAISVSATTVYSVPALVLGVYAIYLLGVWFPLFPVLWGGAKSYVLPSAVLGIASAGYLALVTRTSVLDALGQDYVRTARAKGLRERTVSSRHVLRNSLIPIVTLLAPVLTNLVAGSLFVEYLFGVPGTGTLLFYSILERDYPVVMATTMLYTALVVLGNLLVDLAYGFMDPRIRVGA